MVVENEVQEDQLNETGETTEDHGGSVEELGSDGGTTEDPPEYNPNLTYKVYDEERQFPEYLQSVIDSEEREKELREIFGKGGAFDSQKEKYQQTQSRLQEIEPQYNNMTSTVNRMIDSIKKDDFGTFQDLAGLTDDQVLKHASQIIERKEDPAKQSMYDQQRTAARQASEYETKYNELNQKFSSVLEERHTSELDGALRDPNIEGVANVYDQGKGAGAFRQRVMEYGEWQAAMGKYVTPRDATRAVADMLYVQPASQQVAAPIQQPAASPKVPTLPKVGSGRSVSPTKKGIRTMDDVMAYRKQKYG